MFIKRFHIAASLLKYVWTPGTKRYGIAELNESYYCLTELQNVMRRQNENVHRMLTQHENALKKFNL